jgi:hypothetical protein
LKAPILLVNITRDTSENLANILLGIRKCCNSSGRRYLAVYSARFGVSLPTEELCPHHPSIQSAPADGIAGWPRISGNAHKTAVHSRFIWNVRSDRRAATAHRQGIEMFRLEGSGFWLAFSPEI